MIVLRHSFLLLLLCGIFVPTLSRSIEDFLALGDEALQQSQNAKASEFYKAGIHLAKDTEDYSLSTMISLYTNWGTSLGSDGKNEESADAYEKALLYYQEEIDDIVEKTMKEEATAIASQASLYLGMVYQDLGQSRDAVDAYTYAGTLDPSQWAAFANMGSVFHDNLADHNRALSSYNKAYAILTGSVEPTDPPREPRFILSQLQYRIGLCINHDPARKCSLEDDPNTPVDCKELATHAFSLSVEYDRSNEAAKHMLATLTADSTVERASNEYVKSLFDDYAQNFEHSLVQELGYTGFERLRLGFDRAFSGKPPSFDLVVDAGCGTGLVGEQFRNVSRTLVGVDLSEAIVQEAVKTRPGLYDKTIVGDVTKAFRDLRPISLIVAADSYIYFGDLDPLFESMNDGLQEGGYAAFTLENVEQETEKTLDESKSDWRWQLTASGRFAHRKAYIVDIGHRHGLELVYYEPMKDFRFEMGVGVQGHLFVLKKVSRRNEEL